MMPIPLLELMPCDGVVLYTEISEHSLLPQQKKNLARTECGV